MITSIKTWLKKNPAMYPLAATVLIPLGIWEFRGAFRVVWAFVEIILFLMPLFVLMWGLHLWKMGERVRDILLRFLVPLPPGYIYGTDVKNRRFPLVTLMLILGCTLLYFSLSRGAIKNLVYLPVNPLSLLHIALTFVISCFLHADLSHLAGNMAMLWVVGSNLESRLGSSRFLGVYMLCLFASQMFVTLLLVSEGRFDDFHGLGASGAIAGLMGLFMVRCFFVRFKVCVPVFSLPFFSIPVKVQGAVLLGFLFTLDLFGAYHQVYGETEKQGPYIDYLAHVGGYVAGFFMGIVMKLHRDGAEESTEVKAKRLSENDLDKKKAAALYEDVLSKNPFHEEALRFFLKFHRYSPDKASPYYVALIHTLLAEDTDKAVAVFDEYHPQYTKDLSGPDLVRLGLYFEKTCELYKARLCLEFASEKPGDWQAKALFQLAVVFEKIGNRNRAIPIYDAVATRYPDTHFSREAVKRLVGVMGMGG